MTEVDLKKIYEGIEFLKTQVTELRSEIDELVGTHELRPEYEEKLKKMLQEEGKRFRSVEDLDAALD